MISAKLKAYIICLSLFECQIPLSSEAHADKVEATFKNGVLNITLPKTEQAQQSAKKILIKTG